MVDENEKEEENDLKYDTEIEKLNFFFEQLLRNSNHTLSW